MDRDDRSSIIQGLIERLHRQDESGHSARNDLLGVASRRLGLLAREMLRDYAVVGRHEEADDVLQLGLMKLDRELTKVVPASSREFFALAGYLMRQVLIDLSRHYRGKCATAGGRSNPDGEGGPAIDAPNDTFDPDRLAEWTEFHESVAALPPGDRLLFDLLWYQGMTQAEAAAVLEIPEKQVSRRWIGVRLGLRKSLWG